MYRKPTVEADLLLDANQRSEDFDRRHGRQYAPRQCAVQLFSPRPLHKVTIKRQ